MPKIGPYQLQNPLVLAPMAGVTDRPFRQLCRRHGAGLAVSEMVISDTKFWNTTKSRLRLDHRDETDPISVQIAGADPAMMAAAAKANVERGAQIIDINMGCPAKKVCNKAAGSALMRDEKLVATILEHVVNAVSVPVTLKMRTGWSPEHKNAPVIARLAEQIGIQALAIHGRTRSCKYQGVAEYDTIAQVKAQVRIPVFANGDIDSPVKAKRVLSHTQADGLLIGRAAQGRPWIFNEIIHYLQFGELLSPPSADTIRSILLGHVKELHYFYGDVMGVRIARKHVGWYSQSLDDDGGFRKVFNRLDCPEAQLQHIYDFFETKIEQGNEEEKAA